MTDKLPSDLAEKFMLRLPDGMRDRLADSAKTSGRSMNAEAVQALSHWLSDARVGFPEELRDKLAVVAKANGRSVNAEAVARLLDSFSTEPPTDHADDHRLVALVRRVVREELAAANGGAGVEAVPDAT